MSEKPVRQNVSLLPDRTRRDAQGCEKRRYLDLADRLASASDPEERQRL
jgi:hypothetical protein